MRQFIRKIGLVKSILFFSFLAVCMALVAMYLVTLLFKSWDIPLNMQVGLLISVIITLTITPLMSFYMVRLFLKVDKLEEEMRYLASYDSITGLLTRREFLERANYFHKVALREGLPYAVIIADLDEFKEINDQFGHCVGDQTLETLGQAIQDNMRESDMACRYGGDEFTFFLPSTNLEQAKIIAKRLNEIIHKSIQSSSLNLELTASIGIALYPDHGNTSIEDLISKADSAMYKSKEAGGNQFRPYSQLLPDPSSSK